MCDGLVVVDLYPERWLVGHGNVIMAIIECRAAQPNVPSVAVEVTGITNDEVTQAKRILARYLNSEKQPSDAVAKSFVEIVRLCPDANRSDLWHHVVYRQMLNSGWSDTRWKRASGIALERALSSLYKPRLARFDIRMVQLEDHAVRPESPIQTESGKRIHVLSLNESQPDKLVGFLTEHRGRRQALRQALIRQRTEFGINLEPQEVMASVAGRFRRCSASHEWVEHDGCGIEIGGVDAAHGEVDRERGAMRRAVRRLHHFPYRRNRGPHAEFMPFALGEDVDSLVMPVRPTTPALRQRSRLVPDDLSPEKISRIRHACDHSIGDREQITVLEPCDLAIYAGPPAAPVLRIDHVRRLKPLPFPAERTVDMIAGTPVDRGVEGVAQVQEKHSLRIETAHGLGENQHQAVDVGTRILFGSKTGRSALPPVWRRSHDQIECVVRDQGY